MVKQSFKPKALNMKSLTSAKSFHYSYSAEWLVVTGYYSSRLDSWMVSACRVSITPSSHFFVEKELNVTLCSSVYTVCFLFCIPLYSSNRGKTLWQNVASTQR